MAACRSTTDWKTPRLRRRLVRVAKKPSTALSQEAVLRRNENYVLRRAMDMRPDKVLAARQRARPRGRKGSFGPSAGRGEDRYLVPKDVRAEERMDGGGLERRS
jgi:hypothetical protein